MIFNADGYLDAGLHSSNCDEMKTHLVDPYPLSSSRHEIFAGYCRHKDDLEGLPVEFEQFFDGSFVSQKLNPSDIDLLCIADKDTVDNLSDSDKEKIRQLFQGKGILPDYRCDTYFLVRIPDDAPGFDQYRTMRKYWMGEFGFDRNDKPKGILTINISPKSLPAPTTSVHP